MSAARHLNLFCTPVVEVVEVDEVDEVALRCVALRCVA